MTPDAAAVNAETVESPRQDLTTNVLAFCTLLRAEHGFAVGHAEAYEALRALEVLGISEASHVRSALRLVLCGTREQIAAFEPAFDAFFLRERRGATQTALAARHTRPRPETSASSSERANEDRQAAKRDGSTRDDGQPLTGSATERRPTDDEADPAARWEMLRARFSPAEGRGGAPHIRRDGLEEMLDAARRVAASVHLGPSRRWRPQLQGPRFDLRRTLRTSLGSGGEPIVLKRFGRRPRRARFVAIVDGSRSMAEHAGPMLQFAYGLARASSRARVFFFSTELREVTRELRAIGEGGGRWPDLGKAWGGGTRIGASLHAFVGGQGARCLNDETVSIVFSDGLDVGDVGQLKRAIREVGRRCAGVVWLNPHAASPGYEPTAGAMQAALPHLTLFAAARELRDFEVLARRLRAVRFD